jgi:hypothetical protein
VLQLHKINRRCKDCGKVKLLIFFDRTQKRRQCLKCKKAQAEHRISRTPKSYIRNLVVQLRYSRKKQGHKWDISKEEVYKLYLKQGGKCALSGVEMTHIRTHDVEGDTNISIDRIDPEGLYDIDNIQLVCKRVNFMKHNNNQKNFLNWVGLIYNNTNNE